MAETRFILQSNDIFCQKRLDTCLINEWAAERGIDLNAIEGRHDLHALLTKSKHMMIIAL